MGKGDKGKGKGEGYGKAGAGETALTGAAVQVSAFRKSGSAPIGAAKDGSSWRASGGE